MKEEKAFNSTLILEIVFKLEILETRVVVVMFSLIFQKKPCFF